MALHPQCKAFLDMLAAAGGPPLVDRETFRAAVSQVKERTGQKGRALLHPIRLAVTGEPEGLELDLAVPAIERGALLGRHEGPPLREPVEADLQVRLGVRAIPGAAERAQAFLQALG